MRIAIYPGSFDPVTLGHLDIIRRASGLFDRLIVAVMHNQNKKPMFSVEERMEMLRRTTADLPNVEIESFGGLLADYAKQFGLGEYTGIEIGGAGSAEAKGSMATPEFAERNGLEWTDGQTLTAAIGQSYDLFTPLQLANYIATLVGNGQHYEAHLLKNVKSYDNSSVIYAYDKAPLNTVEMSDSTLQAVKEGMHNLTTGSLSYYFSNCVVSAGAKTGTAETGIANTNNGVFVCFAPYDDPQIAVAVVIEKGGSGAALASTAVDIVNSYFSQEEIGAVVIGENTLLK